MFFVEIPEDALWEYPGFPSIFVSYLKTTSMFFSNPIGLLMLCLLEWRFLNKRIPMLLTLVLIIIESFVMIVFREHYVIDILSGLLFGHYFFILVKNKVKKLDKKLQSFRLRARKTSLVEEKTSSDIKDK